MLYEVTGNLVSETKYTIFCHQTNCQGVMGAGIAKQIKDMYHEVQYQNMRYFQENKGNMLGTNLYVRTSDGRTCVNMYAQDKYGADKRYTDYDAFQKCLDRLRNKLLVSSSNLIVGFPYKIGCGLAGGDWNVIYPMLKKFSENVVQDVYIVRRSNT